MPSLALSSLTKHHQKLNIPSKGVITKTSHKKQPNQSISFYQKIKSKFNIKMIYNRKFGALLLFVFGFVIGRIDQINIDSAYIYDFIIVLFLIILLQLWKRSKIDDKDRKRFCVSVNKSPILGSYSGANIEVISLIVPHILPLKLITQSADGIVRVWDCNGNLIRNIPAISAPNSLLVLNKQLGITLSGNRDGSCDLFDTHNGRLVRLCKFHSSPIISITRLNIPMETLVKLLSPLPSSQVCTSSLCSVDLPRSAALTSILTIAEDGSITLWGYETVSAIKDWTIRNRDPKSATWAVASSESFQSQGRYHVVVALGNHIGEVHVTNLISGKRMVLRGHYGSITAISFYIGLIDKYVISASLDWTLRVWDYHSGSLVRLLEGHAGPVEAVRVYYDSNPVIISVGRDVTLRVWDAHTGALYHTLESDEANIQAIAIINEVHRDHIACHAANFLTQNDCVHSGGGSGGGCISTPMSRCASYASLSALASPSSKTATASSQTHHVRYIHTSYSLILPNIRYIQPYSHVSPTLYV